MLFDLGNVLVHIDPEAPQRALGLKSDSELLRYKENVLEYVYRFEKGNLNSGQLFDLINNLFDRRFSYEQIRFAFMSIIGNPIVGMDILIKTIRQKSHVALASNTNDLHFEHCRKTVPAVRLLHHYYLSYQIGAMKPEPEFFKYVINDLEVDPAAIFFIDDKQENILAASKEDMHAHLFTSIETLKVELQRLGLF